MKISKSVSSVTSAALFLAASTSALAYGFTASNQENANIIHKTYLSSHKPGPIEVDQTAKFGKKVGGSCRYSKTIPMGVTIFDSGDYEIYHGNLMRDYVGGGYTCMQMIYSTDNGDSLDAFGLVWNGYNYVGTTPSESHVVLK